MREEIVKQVQRFREHIYHFFRHRRDAAMDLVDALSSNTHANSVVELSLNPVHRRNYCSITRVIDEYAGSTTVFEKQCQQKELKRLLSRSITPLENRNYHVFAVDCTPQPRISAPTLEDRGIVHAPNPIFGNKPITLGHQYSIAVYLPEKLSTDTPSWVIPLSCERVNTEKKRNTSWNGAN